MKEFIANPETLSWPFVLQEMGEQQEQLDIYAAYIGLDVDKETVVVAIALPGRDTARFECEIGNKPKSVVKLVARLS